MGARGRRERIERAVGARIVELRESRALTQAALARDARMSQSNLAQIESGIRSPTLGSLEKIADALQVDLAELLAGGGTPAKPAKAEKLWFRICDRLRERDAGFLQGVDQLIRALERARTR